MHALGRPHIHIATRPHTHHHLTHPTSPSTALPRIIPAAGVACDTSLSLVAALFPPSKSSLAIALQIYAVPGHARRVLRIDPATGAVDQIGPSFDGHFKWLRAVQVDGAIYGIPCHHRSVLKILPSTGEVSTFGDCGEGEWKWHGAVVAPDGIIYAMPQSAETVLVIDPKALAVSFVGGPFPGRNKWYGGLLGGDGAIYGDCRQPTYQPLSELIDV